MDFVDLHAHVLPGLDDGPATLDQAIELLVAAARDGTRTIVATSHMFQQGLGTDDPEVAKARFELLRNRAEELSGEHPELEGLELHLGAENYLGTEFLEAVETGRALPLGESKTLLIEIWPLTVLHSLRHALDHVLDLGYTPLLAHVERYACLQEAPETLGHLVEAGCLAQVNSGALLKRHGAQIARLAMRWLEEGNVAVVASDMHNLSARPPHLEPIAELLRERFGETFASQVLRDNPAAILADQPTSRPQSARRSWWSRLRA